jgi:ABC-2 type transport system permease protein
VSSYFDLSIAYVVLPAFLILSGAYFFLLNPFFVENRATLRPFFEFAPFVFTLFVPAISMRLLSEERRAGRMETLLTWPIADWELVLGKFFGATCLLASALILTLGLPLSVSALGPLDWGPVIGGYVGLFALGCAYLALGVLVSALTKSQIVAYVGAFALCFGFYVIGHAQMAFPASWASGFEFVSFEFRFARIARGVLDIRDIVFFGSVVFIALALTAEVLSIRRWRRR